MDEAHFWVRNPQNEQFFEGILLLCPKQLCLNLRQGVFRIKCLFGGDFLELSSESKYAWFSQSQIKWIKEAFNLERLSNLGNQLQGGAHFSLKRRAVLYY